jgi:hypothetical protein
MYIPSDITSVIIAMPTTGNIYSLMMVKQKKKNPYKNMENKYYTIICVKSPNNYLKYT